jgi:hypothetical protein
MTFHDGTNERRDRMIVGYNFNAETVIGLTISCDGDTPNAVIDFGGYPLELELVTDSVTALTGLINALITAKESLEEHLVEHATGEAHIWTNGQPLYIPDTWTGDDTKDGEQP